MAASQIENIIYGVKDYVSSGLTAYLTAITTTENDGVALPALRLCEVGERDVYGIQVSPACLVYPETVSVEALSMGADSISVDIALVVAIAGGEPDVLLIQALRYTEAMRQLFTADPTCGGAVDGMADRMKVEYVPAVGDGNYKKVIVFGATFVKDVER